jgi:hypothetical protein
MLNNFGFKDSIQKQIFYRWLFVDTKPLNTDARAALDSNNNNHQSAIQQGFKNYLDAFNNPDVLKSLSMTDEKINNINVYHVYFAPDDNVLNIFWNKYTKKDQNKTQNSYASNYKISDSVKNFVIDIWIDKSTYLIQKSTVRLSIKSPNNGSANVASPLGMLSSQKEDIPVSVSVKLSDFNKPVVFDIPKDAVKFDDLIKGLMPQMQQVGTPSASVKNNNVNPNITKNNSISNTSSNNGLNIGRCKLYGINKNENNSSFIADGEVVNSGSSSWIIKLDQLNPQYGINIDSNTQFVGKQESSYKVGDCLEATIQSSNLKASTISPQ